MNACSLDPHQEDLTVWGIDSRGCFKVSSVFISEDKVNYPMWAKAWIKGIIPKINIYFWTMLQNKILTLDNLQKRGVYLVNRCCLCKMDLEDTNHLFLNF